MTNLGRRLMLLLFCPVLLLLTTQQAQAADTAAKTTTAAATTSTQVLSGAVLTRGIMLSVLHREGQDPLEKAVREIYGHKVATLGTVGIAMSCFGQPMEKAIGMAYAVGAVGVLSLLLRGFPRKFGFSTPGLLLEWVLHVLAAAILWVPDVAAVLPIQVVQGIACFGLLNGLAGIVRPVSFARMWGLSVVESSRPGIKNSTRGAGIGIVSSCVTILLLLANYDSNTALASGCLGFFLADILNAKYY